MRAAAGDIEHVDAGYLPMPCGRGLSSGNLRCWVVERLVYAVEAGRHQVAVDGPSGNGPEESTRQERTGHGGRRLLQAASNVPTLERTMPHRDSGHSSG